LVKEAERGAAPPVLLSTCSSEYPIPKSPSLPAAELLRLPFDTGAAARRNICGMRTVRVSDVAAMPFSVWICVKVSNSVRRVLRERRNSSGVLELRSMTAGSEMPRRR
jgi:hypothetical protein